MGWFDSIQQGFQDDTPPNLNWDAVNSAVNNVAQSLQNGSGGGSFGNNGFADWGAPVDNQNLDTYGNQVQPDGINSWNSYVDTPVPLYGYSPETDGPHDSYFYRDPNDYARRFDPPEQNLTYQYPPTAEAAPEPYLSTWEWLLGNSIWNNIGYTYNEPPDIYRPPTNTI